MSLKAIYKYETYVLKLNYMRIPCVAEKINNCSEPIFKKIIDDKGIYLWMFDCKKVIEPKKDDYVFQLSISVGDIEPDLFDLGYYAATQNKLMESRKDFIEELEDIFYEEAEKSNSVNYKVKLAINNYFEHYVAKGCEIPFVLDVD